MSNARTRRNRRESIAAAAIVAHQVDKQWRTNPMMQPELHRRTRFTRANDSAYRWDGESWVADEARERKVVRTLDRPQMTDASGKPIAYRDGMAGIRWIENAPTVNRSVDDSAMRSKPAKRQQRGGGDDVETWASKGK